MKKHIIKLCVVLLAITSIVLWALYNNNTGPYSGIYDFRENPNLVLRVNDDHTFMLYNAVGKRSEFIKGKYTVDNDNNITLVPNKDNIDKSITETLNGKVNGSIIVIPSIQGEFVKK